MELQASIYNIWAIKANQFQGSKFNAYINVLKRTELAPTSNSDYNTLKPVYLSVHPLHPLFRDFLQNP